MDSTRFAALKEAARRQEAEIPEKSPAVSEYFAEDVFDAAKMQQFLSPDAFLRVQEAIAGGRRIDRHTAAQVAEGMKVWALQRGATHYTHWFQPLNDQTAEKHDAFFEPAAQGGSFETFRGELLVQQEPDASSFPSGGLRNTFEARGYSAWDPSSPAFVLDGTLCIPSVFVSYNGDALDFKTPLLRSIAALDKAAVKVCKLVGRETEHVYPTLGPEQEYFLVDEALWNARPDLAQTGRTLMGHAAAKDQQLDDHYWGAVPARVSAFMKDFEQRAYRLGIPIKTRHNEVAPNQFECATMYEEANIAVDHNLLLMTLMKRTAPRHGLRVLFHEKPFAGVNGSGKHCNWSLADDTGANLLAPGSTPRTNVQFLAFFVSVLRAVKRHSALLMASAASESNSRRLGGNEAPPAVMSVFTGRTLNAVLDCIEESITDQSLTAEEKTRIKLDIGKIPEILLDNTDRNRTSPFAFTGNRFEFRAPGSSANCAMPLIVLNTAVAEQLEEFYEQVTELRRSKVRKDEAVLRVVRAFTADSKDIRFEGNGYSPQWAEEAAKRGLRHVNKVSGAYREYLTPESEEMFVRQGVLTPAELRARYEIKCRSLVKKIQIESRVIGDLAVNHITPTAVLYQNVLLENIRSIQQLKVHPGKGIPYERTYDTLRRIVALTDKLNDMAEQMRLLRKRYNETEDLQERAEGYESAVRHLMEEVRLCADELEMLVDDRLWPLPKYRELLATL